MAVERLRQLWPSLGKGNRIRIINQPQAPLIRIIPHADETDAPENDEDPSSKAGAGGSSNEADDAIDADEDRRTEAKSN